MSTKSEKVPFVITIYLIGEEEEEEEIYYGQRSAIAFFFLHRPLSKVSSIVTLDRMYKGTDLRDFFLKKQKYIYIWGKDRGRAAPCCQPQIAQIGDERARRLHRT